MLDVFAVAEALWSTLRPPLTEKVAGLLSMDTPAAGAWMARAAGLHDLGKATPGFQLLDAGARARLEALGLLFPSDPAPVPHGVATTRVLPALLRAVGVPGATAQLVAAAVGGHHGDPPDPDAVLSLGSRHLGERAWDALRADLFRAYWDTCPATPLPPDASERLPEERNVLALTLAALSSVADWIGSWEKHFVSGFPDSLAADDRPCPQVPPGAYLACARTRARSALEDIGWTAVLPGDPVEFCRMFPVKSPNYLQMAVFDLAERLEPPALAVIETPTGSGKTEAALWLADYLARRTGAAGSYFALPTEATSNQAFGRVEAYLGRLFPGSRVALQLVHGHAALHFPLPGHAGNTAGLTSAGADPEVRSEDPVRDTWFTPKKRALLAPFGVGTVDQSLLSVLRVKHGSVRLFGLAGKTVIVDEVHAYDTYTSSLLDRLLEWLAAMGSSVILLSATLPASRRHALLEAYAGRGTCAPAARYPRLTWATRNGEAGAVHLAVRERRTVHLEWQPSDRRAVVGRLVEELADGGCALWVCNTVRQAQATFEMARQAASEAGWDGYPSTGGMVLCLLHAHYPYRERQVREHWVVDAFGKDSPNRPHRAIVVSTQVIEQSLDVDFDILVTDLAPLDLVLQRAGRLHRHGHRRPAGLASPRLWLVSPPAGDDGPDFGASARVYCEHVLLRSWLALTRRTSLTLPDDTEDLIEAVYGESRPDHEVLCQAAGGEGGAGSARLVSRRLAELKRKAEEGQDRNRRKGKVRLIPGPSYPDDILWVLGADLEDEDPTVHEAFRALTRLGSSIQVVCLHRTDSGLALDRQGRVPVDLEVAPSPELVRELLLNALRLSHGALFGIIARQPTPAGWRRCAYLRYSRPLVFEAGRCELEGWLLELDPELGLVISKEGGETDDV